MLQLTNKSVFITGGSSGIGLETAKMCAKLGSNVTILARDASKLSKAADQIRHNLEDERQTLVTLQADVADYPQLEKTISEYHSIHPIPDILINSAGVARPGETDGLEIDLFRWMMDINYHGTVNTVKTFLPGMLQRRSGHIVNISSVAGFLGVYGYSAYGASKFAVKGFSDSLRQELKPHNINVSIVFPPDTQTPQLEEESPYKPPLLLASEEGIPILDPEAVARSILHGIEKKRYIITPGFISTVYFLLAGLTGGGLIYSIMDLVMADARNKVRRNPGKYVHPHKIDPDQGRHE